MLPWKGGVYVAKMLYSVDVALKALGKDSERPKDKAMRELARYHAALLDEAQDLGDPNFLKSIAKTSGEGLHKALTALGLSPESRGELGKPEEVKVANPFDELKAKRKRKQEAAG